MHSCASSWGFSCLCWRDASCYHSRNVLTRALNNVLVLMEKMPHRQFGITCSLAAHLYLGFMPHDQGKNWVSKLSLFIYLFTKIDEPKKNLSDFKPHPCLLSGRSVKLISLRYWLRSRLDVEFFFDFSQRMTAKCPKFVWKAQKLLRC